MRRLGFTNKMKNFALVAKLILLVFSISSVVCFDKPINKKHESSLNTLRFDAQTTLNTIELQNFTVPINITLKFLLLTRELHGIEESLIIQKINESNDPIYSRSVKFRDDKKYNIKFSDLKKDHTYYLYYFGIFETDNSFIGPHLKVIKTAKALIDSSSIIEEYSLIWTSFLIPILSLILSAFCIRKIEQKSIQLKNNSSECSFSEKRKLDHHFHKFEFKLRDQVTVNQESILSMKNNTKEKVTLPYLQGRNDIDRIIRTLEEENKELEDRLICEICCERFREVIFLSCGHVYCCEKCAMELVTCPIDKGVISSKSRYNMCDKYGINHQMLPQIIASRLQHLDILKPNDLKNNIVKREGPIIEKYLMLKLKNENYKMFSNCILCNERKKNVLFLHCRHLICCDRCSENIKTCPLDGLNIMKKTHVFTA